MRTASSVTNKLESLGRITVPIAIANMPMVTASTYQKHITS